MRICILVAGAGSGASNKYLPLVEDSLLLGDLRSCDIPDAAISVNLEVISSATLVAPERAVEAKGTNRADQVS